MTFFTQICREVEFAAVDFESAGAAPGETDVPVQIGITRFRLEGNPETWMSYISAHKPVRWSAAKVHGITDEMLKDAPEYATLWPDIRKRLQGAFIVGHNLGTEKRFLRTFPGHGFGPWVDTLVLARDCYPGLSDYSLEAVCDVLGVTDLVVDLVPGKKWHDALFDAAASALLLRHIIEALDIGNEPVCALGKALGR